MSSGPSEENNGFTDVEMGPLLGQQKTLSAPHERKKKPLASKVGGGMSSSNSGTSDVTGGGGDLGSDKNDSMDMGGGDLSSPKMMKKSPLDGDGGASSSSSSSMVGKKRFAARKAGGSGSEGKVVFACTLYSGCSVAMVLVNKSLASSYNHLIEGDLNILLVVFQSIVAVMAVEFCKKMKLVEYPPFNLRTAKLWAPVNIFFCLMLFTGMASLQHNNVPMVIVFKNICNIITAAGDRYFFNTQVEFLVKVSFLVMLGGACLAAKHDVKITPVGLFWMMANVFAAAGYILYMKFATKNVKLSKFGMVFYNNVLCTVFLLPVAVAMGQVKIFLTTPAIHSPDYYAKNLLAGFIGFFLNFASLNCISHTGPSTYAMVGAWNKVPISLLGAVMFHDTLNSKTWFFIGVSILGGFLYSYAKIQASRKKNQSWDIECLVFACFWRRGREMFGEGGVGWVVDGFV